MSQQGVGFDLAHGDRVRFADGSSAPLDRAARPWGASGNGPLDREAYQRRYHKTPGKRFAGMTNELTWVNRVALINAFRAGVLGAPAHYSGVPTQQEIHDLMATTPAGHPFYRTYWYDFGVTAETPGRSPENPRDIRLPGQPKYTTADGLFGVIWYYHNVAWEPGSDAPVYDERYPQLFGTPEEIVASFDGDGEPGEPADPPPGDGGGPGGAGDGGDDAGTTDPGDGGAPSEPTPPAGAGPLDAAALRLAAGHLVAAGEALAASAATLGRTGPVARPVVEESSDRTPTGALVGGGVADGR